MQIPSREELRSYLVPLSLRLERNRLKSLPSTNSITSVNQDSLLDTSLISCLSESGYDGDMEDEGDLVLDDVMDDEDSFFNEFQSLDERSMLNRQLGDSSFLASEEYARSTSTPSILRQSHDKAFFEDDLEPMEIEPVAIDNVIDSSNEVHAPIARQPLKQIENNIELSDVPQKPLKKTNQRRKEMPLRTRRIRQNNVHRIES